MSKQHGCHKHTTSYGLIVKTCDGRVVMIERKVPYCVQNFYFLLYHKSKKSRIRQREPDRYCFEYVREEFERECLPKLPVSQRLDYVNFRSNLDYEDKFDFPHGQFQRQFRKPHYEEKYQCFLTAYTEFVEETGYRFSFRKSDVELLKLFRLRFLGNDKQKYVQNYFIVDNVRGLRRHTYFDSYLNTGAMGCRKIKSWNDDRLIYWGKCVTLYEAYNRLLRQQEYKKDYKHLLIYISDEITNHNFLEEFKFLKIEEPNDDDIRTQRVKG